jgi:hypothetical protein
MYNKMGLLAWQFLFRDMDFWFIIGFRQGRLATVITAIDKSPATTGNVLQVAIKPEERSFTSEQ